MKKTITLISTLFLTFNIFAQNQSQIQNQSNAQTQEPQLQQLQQQAQQQQAEPQPQIDSIPEIGRFAIDTLNTDDKYTKILLYDDFTWGYLDLGKPQIDSSTLFDGWNTGDIHAFRDLSVRDLPEEIDLRLVDSTSGFCPPIVGKVRSGFKFRKSREHRGIDIPLDRGDTIRCAFDGVVRVIRKSSQAGGYGNMVVVRHLNGLETYYGHLTKFVVDSGEVVKAGEVLGYGGSTGRSTGPHLHFETRYKGQTFDPERVIDFEKGVLRDSIITLKRHYFSIYSHYGQTDEESKAASGRIVHKVRSGDTLGGIAAKYGTTVSKICKLNGISSKKVLRIGQRIIVR